MSVGSILEIPQNIALALSLASSATGADYNYLVQTAYRESRFEVSAQAPTSSAAGLFQFIEQTWLRTIKMDGEKHGLGKYSSRIFKTRSGRHYVPDAKLRRDILALRRNAKIASLMAGVFARKNADRLMGEIGRVPTSGELYLAHFLGPTSAIRMIKLARSNPKRSAVREFPKAAKANRRIFYSGTRARSVRQVYLALVRSHNKGRKSRKYIRTLARKDASKSRTGHLKRHLKSRASNLVLKRAAVRPGAKLKRAKVRRGRWPTDVRSSAAIRVQLRGTIPAYGTGRKNHHRVVQND